MGTKRVGWARIKSLINENKNQLKFLKRQLLAVSAAKTLTANDSGALIYWTHGSAHDITLPDAEVGLNYTFVLVAGAAANHHILSQTADKFYGKAIVVTTHATHDSANQIVLKASGLNKVFLHKTGATSGGDAGDTVTITCVEAGFWTTQANLVTTHATPASVAVFTD